MLFEYDSEMCNNMQNQNMKLSYHYTDDVTPVVNDGKNHMTLPFTMTVYLNFDYFSLTITWLGYRWRYRYGENSWGLNILNIQ